MGEYKKILLRLKSNIDNYELSIAGCCDSLQKRIFSRDTVLCVCTDCPRLRLIATPLNSAYNTRLFFSIDLSCGCVFDFYFRFSLEGAPTPTAAVQTFTLTDANYGLPIDGSLQFVGR